MDIYSTYYLLAAVRELAPEHTFFKNRYFQTNPITDIFGSAKVLSDFAEGNRKRAPFVLPRIGGKSVAREGFGTAELEPMFISISKPLTIDHLLTRGYGEALASNMSPEERARLLQIEDLADLAARIARSEEYLCCRTMLDNGCVMAHETDKDGVYENVGVNFYEGEDNPALYTPAAPWTHSTDTEVGSWYKDLGNMVKMLTKRGLPARDIILSSDVGEFLLDDIWVQKMLDNRRVEMGGIAPEMLTDYVTHLGTFTIEGKKLDILISDGTYEEDGEDVPYLEDGSVIVTAPDCGRGLYGAVTQLEADGEYHTYAGARVPQHIFTMKPPVKETQLTSRPLMVPKRKNPWTVAKKVFD